MQTSEILDLAADHIEERGWGVGPASTWGQDGAAICAMGALHLAAFGRLPNHTDAGNYYATTALCPAGSAFYDYIVAKEPQYREEERTDAIWVWNDDHPFSEGIDSQIAVVSALRACAVIEASREREAAEVSPEAVSA